MRGNEMMETTMIGEMREKEIVGKTVSGRGSAGKMKREIASVVRGNGVIAIKWNGGENESGSVKGSESENGSGSIETGSVTTEKMV